MNSKYNFVAIEGNTGAGKTSLANMLAAKYDANLILEQFVDNPFLADFYGDIDRFAFPTEMYFLMDRHHKLNELIASNSLTKGLNITDYLLNKSLLYAQVNLRSNEYLLFERFFNALYSYLPDPDLVIYIHSRVPRLIKNIRRRGRDFEQKVEPAYLQRVEDRYMRYFKANPHLKVLIINADELDFVNNPSHYEQILEWVNHPYEPGVNVVEFR